MTSKLFFAAFTVSLLSVPLALMAQVQTPAVPGRPGAAQEQAPGQAQSAQPGAPGQGRGATGGQGGGGIGGDPYEGKKKLLIWVDVQTGFHHDSINHAIAVIEELGRKSGAYVSFIRTDSQLITKTPISVVSARYATGRINARNLSYFDAIFALGSGEGTLSEAQKADLLSFIRDDGKGLILGHAQGVNFYNWPEFGKMIGGFMEGEYPTTGMPVVVKDSSWKAAAAFGKEFFWTDQLPYLKSDFKLGDVHTIIALDQAKMTPEQIARTNRTDGYYPVVWAKSYGKGRVFNVTAGHNDATLDDPKTQALFLEGIQWALGVTNEDVAPDKK
jgi:type 1 glutamine amidotransferase